jgi:undecaprenyl-diphosphatase
MALHTLLLLAVVQGITEFLPVSSSAHLILLPGLTGSEDQGVAIDVAVHVGTLGAVCLYFRREVGWLFRGLGATLTGRFGSPAARFFLLLVLATIPVVLGGAVLYFTGWIDALRSLRVIGWTMLGFGIVLYLADRNRKRDRRERDWNTWDALVMGLWQAIALIPGTSRSGATITAARILGFGREDGARLAMVLSIPTITASGVLLAGDAARLADWQLLGQGALAALFAFVAAYLALAVMLFFLRTSSFTPYVIYRVLLGGILLGISYTGGGA